MIVAAIVTLCLALVALAVGVVVGGDRGQALVWMAVVAAPVSLVALWIGLRSVRPPRGSRQL